MTQQDKEQALALAAIFQAAVLADQVATQGSADSDKAEPLLSSVLNLDPKDFNQIYPDATALKTGLLALQATLTGGQPDNELFKPINYALSLVQLASLLRRNQDLLNILRHRLEALSDQRTQALTGQSQQDQAQRLAAIYVDTVGTLKMRIRVQGEPHLLQDDRNASMIRAFFLAGVRAAFLWHQVGGRRWHLLLSRKRLQQAVQALLSER
jgi:high frequency lysogenization protein